MEGSNCSPQGQKAGLLYRDLCSEGWGQSSLVCAVALLRLQITVWPACLCTWPACLCTWPVASKSLELRNLVQWFCT